VRNRKQRDHVNQKRVADDWAWLDALVGKFDDDLIAAVNEEVPQQERPELDRLFECDAD
jgi:antitoxin VapB